MEPALLIPLPFILLLGFLGYREGVLKRLLEIVGVFATVILTARFAAAVHPWIMERTGADESPALLITWAVLFFGGLILSRMIATLVSKLIRLTILGWLDRWGGALMGAVLGTIIASVVVILLCQAPGGNKLQSTYLEQPLGRFIYYAAPNLYIQARQLFGGKTEEVWSRVMDAAKDQAGDAAEMAKEAAGRQLEESREKVEDAARDAVER